MWANITSAWLCADAAAAVEVWDASEPEAASLDAELPHAPAAATTASAVNPATSFLVLFTPQPFRRSTAAAFSRLDPSFLGSGRGAVVVR